ncbi:hypothetical protein NDU88_002962 [Pleurodeles waltl]|uniref:Uncharacterized protein n=1 Tax=Pleurodeles waltl TaxID=8319 RepID=A0AAV7RDI4_PLEWA|nr:hypothetical protein NDU88_002962 [Pleurodeles waltl]
MRARPTPAQAVEDWSCALLEATQFVTNPFSALREPQDSDIGRGDCSDSEDSPHGSLLTPRSYHIGPKRSSIKTGLWIPQQSLGVAGPKSPSGWPGAQVLLPGFSPPCLIPYGPVDPHA